MSKVSDVRGSAFRTTVLTSVLLALLITSASLQFRKEPVFAQDVEIKSECAVLMDPRSGQILYEKNADKKWAPASLTKIMTLILAFEAIQEGKARFEDLVTASEEVRKPGGTTIFLEVGETMSLKDILLGVAVASGNDASVALAEHLAGSQEAFVRMMNDKARELGAVNTSFKNPHGISEEGHYTTARDMALISSYATRFPDLLKMTSIYQEYLRGGKTWLVNRNRLVNFYEGADGLKTGFTEEAKYCLSATALRDGMRLVAVILGAPDPGTRMADAQRLLNWGFSNFRSVEVARKRDVVGTVEVMKGAKRQVHALASDDFYVTLPKGESEGLEKRMVLEGEVKAPVKKGQGLGVLSVFKGQKELGRIPLIASEDVPTASFFALFARFLHGFLAVR
ncbi:MAG TPA: D-alanyl-D-alanine carboxypeptidase [Clostridia bacterium]|nr:D-alanyl-D-alanine carboxypeptidase [Clostridia bacterium]